MRQVQTTLENAINQVFQQSEMNTDAIVPVSEISFTGLNSLEISGEPFGISQTAQQLLCQRLKIPFSFLSRVDDRNLEAETLNLFLSRETQKRETFFVRFNGSKVRGIFSKRYEVMDSMEALSEVLNAGYAPSTNVHFRLDEDFMSIRIPDEEKSFILKGNDRITPGVSISNSETGCACLQIEAYMFRLICTNGLINQVNVSSKSRHISRRIMENFQSILGEVSAELHRSEHSLRISQESNVADPISSIRSFSKQFGLSIIETEAVERAFSDEDNGNTMFGLVQAFTRVGHEANGLSAHRAHYLESVGGRLLSMVKSN